MYRGFRIENPNFNLRSYQRLQTAFIAQQCLFFLPLLLITIEKYFDSKILNWIKLLTSDIKDIRLLVMIFVISIIIIYNYFTVFKKNVREQILNQYDGKFKTLIKYHLLLFSFLFLLPLILISILDN